MYSQVAGTAAITAPPGTFGRLSNLIAGGRSILNTLERAGGSWVLPQNVWRSLHGVEANQWLLFHEVRTLSPHIVARRIRVRRMRVGYSGGVDGSDYNHK